MAWTALHACSGGSGPADPGPPPGPTVATVEVTPAAVDLETGDTATLTAVPRAADGTALNVAVTWSSSNEAAATVSPTGVVTGRGTGEAEIRATAQGITGTADVAVVAAVATVDVASPAQGVAVGNTVQLTATPRAGDGAALARAVTWASSDESVAMVDANGLVTAVAPGEVEITASAGVAAIGDLVPAAATGSVTLLVTIDWSAFEGNWVGQWVNTSFGSTGAITATLTMDLATLEAILLIDVDGTVLGAPDPMPTTIVAPIGSTSIEVDYDAPLHGPIRLTLVPGAFDVASVTVPAQGIGAWTYTGTNTDTTHTATFTVTFSGGGGAQGTVNVQKQ